MTASGRVVIADRVVERIATHALAEVPEVGSAARRVLGMPIGQPDIDEAPRAQAHVDGSLATLAVTMSVTYPSPVRKVAGQVRQLVTKRVGELTGLDVRQVDVDIARLVTAESSRRRVQ